VGLVISTRESGEVTILDLRGRSTIDPGESEFLERYLQKLIESGALKLLLNLADLIQIDSSGLSVIVTTFVSLRARGGELKFLCPRGRVLEVFKVLHLPQIIPSFEDEARALASFRPRSCGASSS
jgi:anti-anti-sigma factor